MAIDTEGKRRSVLGAFMVALTVLPVPDGTVGTQDRPHVAGIYAGITIATSTVPDICGPLHSGIVDPDRITGLLNPARLSGIVDPDRITGLECD